MEKRKGGKGNTNARRGVTECGQRCSWERISLDFTLHMYSRFSVARPVVLAGLFLSLARGRCEPESRTRHQTNIFEKSRQRGITGAGIIASRYFTRPNSIPRRVPMISFWYFYSPYFLHSIRDYSVPFEGICASCCGHLIKWKRKRANAGIKILIFDR